MLLTWLTEEPTAFVSVFFKGKIMAGLEGARLGVQRDEIKEATLSRQGWEAGMEASWSSFEGRFLILSMLTCTLKVEPLFL